MFAKKLVCALITGLVSASSASLATAQDSRIPKREIGDGQVPIFSEPPAKSHTVASILSQQDPITVQEILRLLREGTAESAIVEEIRERGCLCDMNAFDVMVLRGAGASSELLAVIREASDTSPRQRPTTRQQPQQFVEPTRATVFGGYSYGRTEGDLGGFNWNGVNGAVTGHVNDWFGITGDFSWHFVEVTPGLDVDLLQFSLGPQFSTWGRTRRVRGFGHVLVGASRLDAELFGFISDDVTAFSSVVGGGLDVGVTEHFALRVFQSDWLRFWNIGGEEDWDFLRLSFGIVGRF